MKDKLKVLAISYNNDIEVLSESINEAIGLGATNYKIHLQNNGTMGPYVQSIEFYKVKTKKDLIQERINKLEKELSLAKQELDLELVEEEISNCPNKNMKIIVY